MVDAETRVTTRHEILTAPYLHPYTLYFNRAARALPLRHTDREFQWPALSVRNHIKRTAPLAEVLISTNENEYVAPESWFRRPHIRKTGASTLRWYSTPGTPTQIACRPDEGR